MATWTQRLQGARIFVRDVRLPLLLLVISLLIFAATAMAVAQHSGWLQALDEQILRAVRNPSNPAEPIGPSWLAKFILQVTALGGRNVVTGIAVAAVLALAWARQWISAAQVVVAVGGGSLVSFGLKELFQRPRPSVVPHLIAVRDWSFPSVHSFQSAVLYGTLAVVISHFLQLRAPRTAVYLLAALFALSIGLTRVYLGVHYPSDVLGGWSSGLAWAFLCGLGARWIRTAVTARA